MSIPEEPAEVPWTNSLFEQPWWLEATAPGAWRDVRVERGGEVVGRLPYVERRHLGLTFLSQPPLTPTLGPWLAPSSAKRPRRLEFEKKVMTELIEQLPPFAAFTQHFSPEVMNWLPFYWAGFRATVYYTYRIPDSSSVAALWDELGDHVRRMIRRAERQVSIETEVPLEDVLTLNRQTFERQGIKVPYSGDVLRRIDAACSRRGARRIFAAVDASGRTHGVLYFVWDQRAGYPLVNATDPALRGSGANSMLWWEAIQFASNVTDVFDCEGSMIEPVEHFIRGFGGELTPYLRVTRQNRRARALIAARAAQHGAQNRLTRALRRSGNGAARDRAPGATDPEISVGREVGAQP